MDHILFTDFFLVILVAAWLGGSIAGGAVLAFLTKRIHKNLSFRKNWLFFSALLAAVTGLVLGVAIR